MRIEQGSNKISVVSISSSQQDELEQLTHSFSTPNGYRWLSPGSYPSVIPGGLQDKLTAALLMWERTSSGCTVIVCNGLRVDQQANALDQEPFGVAVRASGASTSGIFAHHGTWQDRTIPITAEIRSILESTSLGKHFPLGEAPPNSSGALSDLSDTSHAGAFDAVVHEILRPGS